MKKKLFVIVHGNLLSYRLEDEYRFRERKMEPVEVSILESLSQYPNRFEAILSLSQEYSCTIATVEKRINEMAEVLYEEKIDWDEVEVKFWRRVNIIPLQTTVEFTKKCNMQCKYCYVNCNSKKPEGELSFEDWQSLLTRNILDSGMSIHVVQLLNLTGGEPTTHPDIIPFLRWTYGKFMISFFTNCLELDANLLQALVEHPNLVRVNTSFDSDISEKDEKMRGPGFARRLNNLHRLDENGFNITVNVGISWQTPEDAIETAKFFLTEFVHTNVRFGRIEANGRASTLPTYALKTRVEFRRLITELWKTLETFRSRISFEDNLTDEKDEEELYRCNFGYGIVIITPEGIAKPCMHPIDFFQKINANNFCIDLKEKNGKQKLLIALDKAAIDVSICDLRGGCALPYLLK